MTSVLDFRDSNSSILVTTIPIDNLFSLRRQLIPLKDMAITINYNYYIIPQIESQLEISALISFCFDIFISRLQIGISIVLRHVGCWLFLSILDSTRAN